MLLVSPAHSRRTLQQLSLRTFRLRLGLKVLASMQTASQVHALLWVFVTDDLRRGLVASIGDELHPLPHRLSARHVILSGDNADRLALGAFAS